MNRGWGVIPNHQSATLLIEGPEGILFNLRDDKDWIWAPGHWSLPGGQVEPGETLVVAAVRECREETGIAIDPTRLRSLTTVIETGGVSSIMHYRADSGEFTLLTCNEGQRMRWLPKEMVIQHGEFEGFPLVPIHREALMLL